MTTLYVVSKLFLDGNTFDVMYITSDIELAVAMERKLDRDGGNYVGVIDSVKPDNVSIKIGGLQ